MLQRPLAADTGIRPQPFRSAYERQEAMASHRYKVDAAYREDVAARLSVTPEYLP